MTKIKDSISALVLLSAISIAGTAAAQEGSTLGFAFDYPQIDANPIAGSDSCKFDGSTLTLISTATNVVFAEGAPSEFILDATTYQPGAPMTLTANINPLTGALISGTFTVDGLLADGGPPPVLYMPPLLTGTIDNFGIREGGSTDEADFLLTPTGGTLFSGGIDQTGATQPSPWPAGANLGVFYQLNLSDYTTPSDYPNTSGFGSAWNCGGAKGTAGPVIEDSVNCNISIVKTADRDSIGPIGGSTSYNDSDSDSGGSHDSDSDSDGSVSGCGCRGKVSDLVLQYNGTSGADVVVTSKKLGVLHTQLNVQQFDTITINPATSSIPGFNGSLGTNITISNSMGAAVDLHTSCSEPIGPGMVVGDFMVVSGYSKKLSVPLCPLDAGTCPTNQFVTFTYTVTNLGDPVTGVQIVDDPLGLIGGSFDLNDATPHVETLSVCLYQDHTNTATATGAQGADMCASPVSNEVVIDNITDESGCSGADSDSDTGGDGNGNGDTDDTDSDSDSGDCDGDDGVPPPPPATVLQGCGPKFWKAKANFDEWTDASISDKFNDVFGVASAGNKTLLKVLKKGGGNFKALGRHAVAGLLNARHSGIYFAMDEADVLAIVQNAYATADYATASSALRDANQAGCPLD